MSPLTAIFDIGKTNKKCLLYDARLRELRREVVRLPESRDEDGFPCEDLEALITWVREQLQQLLQEGLPIGALNFTTYGASLVHLDARGRVLTPLYNYLKPYPAHLLARFYEQYGPELALASETASPPLQMLNAGLQLYWLRHARPAIFQRIRWSLHLPQYLSYCFTGLPVNEFTSLGCHTCLWHFGRGDYHPWVYAEGLERVLPPIVPATTSLALHQRQLKLRCGVGIHDSSAALLPYRYSYQKPFLLISTGTWSIALNPFNEDLLSPEELQQDCLNFLGPSGKAVRAARLFLGKEYEWQMEKLLEYFHLSQPPASLAFEPRLYEQLLRAYRPHFRLRYIPAEGPQPAESLYERFPDFRTACHQLMLELVLLQVAAARRAMGSSSIGRIFVDGGFAANELYMGMMARQLSPLELRASHSAQGAALGAALLMTGKQVKKKWVKRHVASPPPQP